MFSSQYLKSVVMNGKLTEHELSSIVTHTNHIGLRQHLASNNKIIVNDDADLIAESFGLYNINDPTKEHERNLILCGYDGQKTHDRNEIFSDFLISFTNALRTTGTSMINIENKRLTILIATTGGKLMKNMKTWLGFGGFDGTHNGFLYMSIPKRRYSRPQK